MSFARAERPETLKPPWRVRPTKYGNFLNATSPPPVPLSGAWQPAWAPRSEGMRTTTSEKWRQLLQLSDVRPFAKQRIFCMPRAQLAAQQQCIPMRPSVFSAWDIGQLSMRWTFAAAGEKPSTERREPPRTAREPPGANRLIEEEMVSAYAARELHILRPLSFAKWEEIVGF